MIIISEHEPIQGEIDPDVPSKKTITVAEAVQRTVSGLALAMLQETLDKGGTISIPSLGIVIDNKGSGPVVDLDSSRYTIGPATDIPNKSNTPTE